MNNNNKRERRFDADADADADAEEKKMDKFYELMRKFRHERDRLRSQIFNDLQNKKKKIRPSSSSSSSPSTATRKQQSSWAPSFKLEDFADNEEFQFVKPPLIFPSPTTTTKKRDHDQQDDATLNLELALSFP